MNNTNAKHKKGFTIAELVVVLALCAIMAATTIITVNVVSLIVSKNGVDNEIVSELDICYTFINKKFHEYDETSSLYSVSDGKLTIVNGSNEYTFIINDNKILFMSGEEVKDEVDCNNFCGLKFFIVKDNIFKCVLEISEDETYDFLISKRSE